MAVARFCRKKYILICIVKPTDLVMRARREARVKQEIKEVRKGFHCCGVYEGMKSSVQRILSDHVGKLQTAL